MIPAALLDQPGWLPILMYHRVARREPEFDPNRLTVSLDQLGRQLDRLRAGGFSAVPLDLAIRPAGRAEGLRYAITFDDGYRDTLELALPLLQARSVAAIVFVPSGHLGKSSSWDHDSQPLMSPGELRQWHEAGMLVGSHSRNHFHLTRLPTAKLRDELRGSKADLEDLLGDTVRFFAYPYHDLDERVMAEVAEAGYLSAVGGRAGTHARFNLHRVDPWGTEGWRLMVSAGGLLHHARRLAVPRTIRRLAGRLL